MNYVFDVDGTLTPSRERMDPEFEAFFMDFVDTHPVYLVTGSDYEKTEEQLGSIICGNVEGVYNCSGNMLTRGGVVIYSNEFELTDDERSALKNELYASGFSVRTGNHIEQRIGAANWSIVGRNATRQQRETYVRWDRATNERVEICKRLNSSFERLECVVGGETSIDIYLKGKDKSQIAEHIRPFTFFGDRCEVGGNDHTLFCIADHAIWVNNWQNTFAILRAMEKGHI
jgi:phosphomannomutase